MLTVKLVPCYTSSNILYQTHIQCFLQKLQQSNEMRPDVIKMLLITFNLTYNRYLFTLHSHQSPYTLIFSFYHTHHYTLEYVWVMMWPEHEQLRSDVGSAVTSANVRELCWYRINVLFSAHSSDHRRYWAVFNTISSSALNLPLCLIIIVFYKLWLSL